MPTRRPPAWIAHYVGRRFKSRGRGTDGVDCWGLVRLIYLERLGVMLPSYAERYSGVDNFAELAAIAGDALEGGDWQRVEPGREIFGDVARFMVEGHPAHVALVVAPGDMLHVMPGLVRSRLERFDTPAWSPRLVDVHRYAGLVQLLHRPDLFSSPRKHLARPGGSIEELVRAHLAHASPGLQAFIGEVRIPREAWAHVRPKPGRVVRLVEVPEGSSSGDRNKAPRLVATIAVLAASIALPHAGALAGTKLATGTVGGALFSAGASIVGSLLVNTLLPPPRPGLSEGEGTRSRTIEGARNELRPYGVVPCVLGRHRIVPPFGATPYTEIIGDDQYVRMLFIAGYGPLELDEFKIGETLLSEFEGVEVEVRHGHATDAPLTLYPGTVHEEALSVLVNQASSWITRTTEPATGEISLDLTFPQGLAEILGDGTKVNRTVTFDVEYSPTGAGTWQGINATSPTTADGMGILFRTPEQVHVQDGTHNARIAWGSGFPDAKPGYLPTAHFSWEASGWLYTDSPGVHTFAVDGSDACEVIVDGQVVASWYGSHAPAGSPDLAAHTGTISLTRGFHSFMVRMESRSGTGNIAVGWQQPAGSMAIIPATQFWRSTRGFGAGLFPGLTYRAFDTSSWSGALSFTDNRTDQVRRSIAWAVPPGQYDVRVRRNTADSTAPNILDEAYWTALRSIVRRDPVALKGLALIALRIKATDQLNGAIDNFNCMAHSVMPDWDAGTGQWLQRATSNPASCYRAVLQGPANRRPIADTRVAIPDLQEWHEACDDLELQFNAVCDTAGTVWQRLNDIAVCGRASPNFRDGLVSVFRDRAQTVPRQHFTPRNSRGFKLKKAFPDRPHALRMQYLDPGTGYQRAERVVLDDGYAVMDEAGDKRDAFGSLAPALPLASKFQTVEMLGVTSATEAFKHGRYMIASARLRPAIYELSCDVEHFPLNRGELVLVTHDVPQWGLGFGRVAGLNIDGGGNVTHVNLDAQVTMDTGTDYRIRFRLEDGTSLLADVVTVNGNSWTVELQTPITSGSPAPKKGDLWMFGPVDMESRELIVKAITMEEDLGARLTLVDHAPAVHDADVGTIPDFDPGITLPPSYNDGPETPVIERIQSDDYVMVRETDGTLSPRLVLFLRRPSGLRPIPNLAQVRLRRKPEAPATPTGPFETRPFYAIDDNRVVVDRVEEGVTYQIRLRTLTAAGRFSGVATAEHTIVGKTLPPPDVQDFDVSRMVDGTRRFSWDLGVIPPDVAGVRIRFGPAGSGTWSTLAPLHDGTLEGASPVEMNVPPEGSWRFAIKMIDTSGNESVNALVIDRDLGPPRQDDIAVSEDAVVLGWPGTKTGCFVSNDRTLEARSSDDWATLPATWAGWTRWNRTPISPITYVHTIDAGFIFAFEPAVNVYGDGEIVVEFASSDDNVAYTSYAPIEDFRELAVVARYARFRVTVTATGGEPVPRISTLAMHLRAKTRTHAINDQNTALLASAYRLGVGDVRLPVPAGMFRVIRGVSVSFNGTGAGWTWELLDRDAAVGPHVRLFNPSHALADAVVDAIVYGYG